MVLAEDQGMVLGALAALLEIEGDISVVAQGAQRQRSARSGAGAQARRFHHRHRNAAHERARCGRRIETSPTGTRVVIVTTFARAGYLRRALEAGASGYLLKDMRAEELADAVRRVHQGLRVIHPELATEAWGEMDPLTDRERQVLRLAGEGMASGDIAERTRAVRRHGAKLSIGSHQQTRREQSRGSRKDCENEGLVSRRRIRSVDLAPLECPGKPDCFQRNSSGANGTAGR